MKGEEETLNVNLPADLMEELRKRAQMKFGHKRGYMKKAALEAVTDWVAKQKNED